MAASRGQGGSNLSRISEGDTQKFSIAGSFLHQGHVIYPSLLIFRLVTPPSPSPSPSLSQILHLPQLSLFSVISASKFNCYTIF